MECVTFLCQQVESLANREFFLQVFVILILQGFCQLLQWLLRELIGVQELYAPYGKGKKLLHVRGNDPYWSMIVTCRVMKNDW